MPKSSAELSQKAAGYMLAAANAAKRENEKPKPKPTYTKTITTTKTVTKITKK